MDPRIVSKNENNRSATKESTEQHNGKENRHSVWNSTTIVAVHGPSITETAHHYVAAFTCEDTW